ncbi:unnamed protein product [Somion occarium]|uniref:Uncharacterized protein n=1 Tax=Somion occarium TaxID=3059160 RepID=A0ABP1E2H3_9APHY
MFRGSDPEELPPPPAYSTIVDAVSVGIGSPETPQPRPPRRELPPVPSASVPLHSATAPPIPLLIPSLPPSPVTPAPRQATPPPPSARLPLLSPSPSYPGPSSYKIGEKMLPSPLVTIDQLKAHLTLLGAFKSLRTTVQTQSAEELILPPVVERMDVNKRWTWFVGLAVERFQRWVETARNVKEIPEWIEKELPPLDVLMVWHSYMLNPNWYREDLQRSPLLRILRDLGSRLLTAVILIGDIGSYVPSEERITSWQELTGTFFDPLASASCLSHRNLECPYCWKLNEAPLITGSDTGYLQNCFRIFCSRCSKSITKATLAISKFASKESHFLAGTSSRYQGLHVARRIKHSLLQNKVLFAYPMPSVIILNEMRTKLLERINGSLEILYQQITTAVAHVHRRHRICSAYIDDRPFSVELVSAVIRQGSFIDRIHNLGWLDSGHFEGAATESILIHAIVRYHAFLDLMTPSCTMLLVPTLDIDLAWHTHQMTGYAYGDDCVKFLGHLVDHNDKIESNYLADAFDKTCLAWERRFNIPYMHCGCPLPEYTSVGKSLSRMASKLSLSRTKSANPLSPPSHPGAFEATHPSDHNAIDVQTRRSIVAHENRLEMLKQRRERDAKKVEHGKMDSSTYRRGMSHDDAFLYPVSFNHPPVVTRTASSPAYGSPGTCAVGAGVCGSLGGYGGSCASCGSGGPSGYG